MIFRKTERFYRRRDRTFIKEDKKVWPETHTVVIKRIIYWFLFIPVFYKEEIIKHNI